MGDKLSNIGGRMARARNRQLTTGAAGQKSYQGAFKNAKTREESKKTKFTMGPKDNAERRKST